MKALNAGLGFTARCLISPWRQSPCSVWLRPALQPGGRASSLPPLLVLGFSPLWQHLDCRERFAGPAPERKTGRSMGRGAVLAAGLLSQTELMRWETPGLCCTQCLRRVTFFLQLAVSFCQATDVF